MLYRRELRSAFRERSVVVNSILIPIVLYPVLLWAQMSGFVFVMGLSEGFTSRVAVLEPPAAHQELIDSLRTDSRLELLSGDLSLDEATLMITRRDLDAVAEFLPPDEQASALADNFSVRIHYDRSIDRSRRAQDRIDQSIEDYRSRWLDREAAALGFVDADRIQFRIAGANISSGEDLGTTLLSVMIPFFLVISVALGCLVPSIDSTAGERERSTWETLMTTGASRLSIVTSKYLYVASIGALAGMLNVTAMFLAMGPVMAPLQSMATGEAMFQFGFTPMAMAVMLMGALLLALFFAASMMLLAAFARSFKDGQAMVTPVFYVALIPIVLGQQSDQTLTPTVAAIPVANVAMMVRDAINGVYLWPLIAETLVVGLLLVSVCLMAARAVLRFEDFLLGSFDGSFWRFLRSRLLVSRRTRQDRKERIAA